MGVGNQGGGGNSGNKRSNHNFEHRQLLALGELVASSSTADLATEATLISVLNAIVASDQDIEILLVRDTGNNDEVVQQITDYQTGVPVVTYKDVNGNPYVPVGPLEYLDPSAVLNLMLTELLTLNAGGQLLTEATFVAEDFATETTLAALNTAFGLEDFATETTLALVNANIALGNITLNSINTVLNNIKLDTANLDVALSTRSTEATQLLVDSNLTLLNTKLNTLGQKASALSAPVVLSTEQQVILDAIKTAVENIDADLGTGGLATETTLQAVETLITSTNALLTTIDADTSNLDVLLSTRASELTLQATNTLLTTIDGVLDAIKIDTGALVVDLAAIEVLITSANALLTIMASDLAGINTEIQLTNIELSNIKVDTGNIATDTSTLATPVTGLAAVNLRVTGAGAASVVAGKRRVSFFNAGDVDTTVAGATLKAGEITTFVAGERDVLAAIAYDALASELLISTIG